jgi:AGZA family xanthine/uracil permease-like MFS transporter
MIYLTKIISRGYIVPEDADQREYWTYKPGGQLPWFVRLVQDPKGIFGTEGSMGLRSDTARSQSNGSIIEDNKMSSEKA